MAADGPNVFEIGILNHANVRKFLNRVVPIQLL